jgi:hypothetical protein
VNKRARNKEQNENEILSTAIRLFVQKGDDATTIGDIVSATSLARGTFYNYFEDKKEIWDLIISRIMQEMYRSADRERSQSTSVRDFIYTSLYSVMLLFDAEPYRQLITNNSALFRDAFFRNKEIDIIIEIFESDMRKSTLFQKLPDYYYRMTVYALQGSCLEILIQSYQRDDKFSVEQITEYITATFENSLLEVGN